MKVDVNCSKSKELANQFAMTIYDEIAMGIDTRGNQFPKYPHKLSMRINEIKRNLVVEGISIEKSRNNDKREIHIINNNYKPFSVPIVNNPMIRKEENDETDNNPSFIE